MSFIAALIVLINAISHTQATESMEYISLTFPLSSHGLHIPRLGLGTAGLGSNTGYITRTALQYGVRLIDTAQAPEWYSERGVGDGLQDFLSLSSETETDSITTITKIHPRSFGRPEMESSIIDSKKSIYGDSHATLDVVLLHSPHCWAGHCNPEEESVTWQIGWKNLELSMASGHMLAIGVSNFDIDLLEELLHVSDSKVSVVQNWMDPFHQDTEVRRFASEHNIVYMAYSSFGTQWQGKYDVNPVLSNAVLERIALKHDTTVAAVVISWLLQENVVAIPRASNIEHIIENAAPIKDGMQVNALRVFLDGDDMSDILSLDGTLGSPWD